MKDQPKDAARKITTLLQDSTLPHNSLVQHAVSYLTLIKPLEEKADNVQVLVRSSGR